MFIILLDVSVIILDEVSVIIFVVESVEDEDEDEALSLQAVMNVPRAIIANNFFICCLFKVFFIGRKSRGKWLNNYRFLYFFRKNMRIGTPVSLKCSRNWFSR